MARAQTAQPPSVTQHPVRISIPIVTPWPLFRTNPTYPAAARAAGIQGQVAMRLHLLKDGTVGYVTVLSGPPELHEAASTAVSTWRYSPRLLNNEPIEADLDLTIAFNLNDGSSRSMNLPKALHLPPAEFAKLLVHSVPPIYPAILKSADFHVTVILHIMLDEHGRIIDLGVVSGHPLANNAALSAVSQWMYRPYLPDRKAVPVESTVSFSFGR